MTAACSCAMLQGDEGVGMTATPRRRRRIAVAAVAIVTVVGPGLTAVASASSSAAASPPSTAASAGPNLCAPPKDTVPPVITAVTFSTKPVSLNVGTRQVMFTAHATDTSGGGVASGVRQIGLSISGPREGARVVLARTGGTGTAGTWKGVLTIPRNGPAGRWTLREVRAVDGAGNHQTYDNYSTQAQAPTDIGLQPGWDTSFEVTGVDPSTPPKLPAGHLVGLTLSSHDVDSRAGARTVRVIASFSRPQPTVVGIIFLPVHRSDFRLNFQTLLHHTTGHSWVARIPVGRWIGSGKSRAQLYAGYGARVTPAGRTYDPASLRALHLHPGLTVHGHLDTTPPTPTTLRFSPAAVDTTSGPKSLTVHATETDAQSGVELIRVGLTINRSAGTPSRGRYPYPGIGFRQDATVTVNLHRNGSDWVGTTTIPRCVPNGKWRTSILTVDKAENEHFYTSKALTKAGLPGTVTVASNPGDTEPPYVMNATASIGDHTIALDFTEGVENVTPSTLTVFPLSPVATRFVKTTPISAITCQYGATDTACDGSGGLVTSAVLTVPGLRLGHRYQVWANPHSITSQLTDGTGNPMPWEFAGADVTAS
jgi:hypothetical protein